METSEVLSFPQKSIFIDLVTLLLFYGKERLFAEGLVIKQLSWHCTHLLCKLICALKLQFAGPEIATNIVAFATEFFSLCDLKYAEKSQICDLISPVALSKQKG